MKLQDPTRDQDPGTTTDAEVEYRVGLNAYFANSIGNDVEKLSNFAKYVPRQTLTTFISKYEMFKTVLPIQGSIVECGVYLGGGLMTFAQLSAILEPVNHRRKIIGFDTFSGIAELSSGDEGATSVHAKPAGFSLDADVYDDLTRCIALYDSNRFISHIPKVFLVKGNIKETLPKYLDDNPHTVVSLLFLDVDLFEPTKVALDCLVPRMPKGAVIGFGELNDKEWPGETLALSEALGINGLRIQRPTFDSGLSFAIIE